MDIIIIVVAVIGLQITTSWNATLGVYLEGKGVGNAGLFARGVKSKYYLYLRIFLATLSILLSISMNLDIFSFDKTHYVLLQISILFLFAILSFLASRKAIADLLPM